MVKRLEKSSTRVMVTCLLLMLASASSMEWPSLSQLKLTGGSPRVSPQRTRERAPNVSTEDSIEESEKVVPKLKGANTGGTEGKKNYINTLDVDARANGGLTGAVDGRAGVVANVQLMEGLNGQHGVELVKVDYFDGRNLKIR